MYKVILSKLFQLDKLTKRIIQVLVDCFLIVLCFATAMYLRLDDLDFIYNPRSWYVLLTVIPVSIFVFIRSGLYRAIIRYISSRVLKVIIFGSFISAVTMFVTDQIFVLPVPRSVPIIYVLLLFSATCGIRFSLRTAFRYHVAPSKENIIIFGAGHAGRQLLNTLDLEGKYRAICFIDDNTELAGREIGGIPIYVPSFLEETISKQEVRSVLLAVPTATVSQRQKILSRIENFSVEVRTIPSIGDLITGKSKVSDLKIVRVEELLGRDAVDADPELLAKNITDKTVLVSGAGGSIGSELCRQILMQKPDTLILFDVSEYALYQINEELEQFALEHSPTTKIVPVLGSVLDKGRIHSLLKKFKTDSVYHAAAYKHVTLVEQNIVVGMRNNIWGTKNIIEAAIKAKVKNFTLISTDKAVRPTNIMGASKRIAELICQAVAGENSDTKVSIVRFGNVLGSSGSVIPKFREQIKNGGPVTVTDAVVTRYFMTIREAAQLVIQASSMSSKGDIFLLDMGTPVKIIDLVERMIRLHGFTPFRASENDRDLQSGEIEVVITGLRPGEKLYEELLIEGNPTETAHPRIFTDSEFKLSPIELDELLKTLLKSCDEYDLKSIRSQLQKSPVQWLGEVDT